MFSDIKKLIDLIGINTSYFLIIFLYVISSFLDILGLGLVGTYISYLLNQSYSSNLFFIDTFTQNFDYFDPTITIGIFISFIFFLKFFLFLFANSLIISFSNNQVIKMRNLIMSKYQKLNYLDFLKKNKSEYIFNANELSTRFSKLLISILKIIGEFIIIIFIISFLLLQNFYVTITTIIILFLIYFIYDKFFKNRLNEYGKLMNDSAANIHKYILETLVGLKEIRILGKEKYFLNQINQSTIKYTNTFKKVFLISVMPKYLFEYLFILLVITFTLIIFYLEKNLNEYLPVIAIFILAGIRLFPIANSILNSILDIRANRNSIKRLHDVITNIPDYKITKNNNQKNNFFTEFESLEIDNISFKYEMQKDFIFNNTSLLIQSGKSIGISGVSGSGKSTLIDIIVGLIKPNKGKIKINGNDVADNLWFIQNYISYIPQQLFLVDGTICENIALGVDKDKIDLNKVNLSIKKASLFEFVDELPNGTNTIIGDNGVKISGGQRQRIGIARSFYFEKNILIFDEATNALDAETEAEIIKNIKEIKNNKTLLIISHKNELLDFCDQVYEIKDQKIIKKNKF